MEPGDIIIVLDEKEHAQFKRNGIDLIHTMNISLSDSLCSFKRTITTLDDRTLVIQTVPGEAKLDRYVALMVCCVTSGQPLLVYFSAKNDF